MAYIWCIWAIRGLVFMQHTMHIDVKVPCNRYMFCLHNPSSSSAPKLTLISHHIMLMCKLGGISSCASLVNRWQITQWINNSHHASGHHYNWASDGALIHTGPASLSSWELLKSLTIFGYLVRSVSSSSVCKLYSMPLQLLIKTRDKDTHMHRFRLLSKIILP